VHHQGAHIAIHVGAQWTRFQVIPVARSLTISMQRKDASSGLLASRALLAWGKNLVLRNGLAAIGTEERLVDAARVQGTAVLVI
jgi:hypothetical protein